MDNNIEEKIEYDETSVELLKKENNMSIFEIIEQIQKEQKEGKTY